MDQLRLYRDESTGREDARRRRRLTRLPALASIEAASEALKQGQKPRAARPLAWLTQLELSAAREDAQTPADDANQRLADLTEEQRLRREELDESSEVPRLAGRPRGTCTAVTEVEQDLPLDASSPAKARALVEQFRPAVSSDAMFRLRLIVSELVANCLRHGGGTGSITFRAVHRDRRVELRVSCAKGLTSPRLRTPGYNSDGSGGLGLQIVETLAVRWGVADEPDGPDTAVWVELSVD